MTQLTTSMSKLKSYLYKEYDTGNQIRIRANRKPGPNTIPKRGTWVVQEYENGKWVMPSFPEITWGSLRKLFYAGVMDSNGNFKPAKYKEAPLEIDDD